VKGRVFRKAEGFRESGGFWRKRRVLEKAEGFGESGGFGDF